MPANDIRKSKILFESRNRGYYQQWRSARISKHSAGSRFLIHDEWNSGEFKGESGYVAMISYIPDGQDRSIENAIRGDLFQAIDAREFTYHTFGRLADYEWAKGL